MDASASGVNWLIRTIAAWLPEDPTAFAPTKPWKLLSITHLAGSLSQSQPTNSAEEASFCSSLFVCLSEKAQSDEEVDMKKNPVSTYAETTVILTVEGRIALATDALASAVKARTKQRRKLLCERALNLLHCVVQD